MAKRHLKSPFRFRLLFLAFFPVLLATLLANSQKAAAEIHDIPSIGLSADFDSATGSVTFSQVGLPNVIVENVGRTGFNAVLLSEVDEPGVLLYERNGTALILRSTSQDLTLVSKTYLPAAAWPGANVVREGFRYVESPNGKISVAIFRHSYSIPVFGRPATQYLRTVLSNLTEDCAFRLNQLLPSPTSVDPRWERATPIVLDFITANEADCQSSEFGHSLPKP